MIRGFKEAEVYMFDSRNTALTMFYNVRVVKIETAF